MTENWWLEGSCRDHPNPGLWFPTQGGDQRRVQEARRICAGCPVQPECLDYAIRGSISDGIWGGKSEEERRKIKRKRRLVDA